MLYISVTEKNECESELDCPGKTPCSQPLSYISNMELLIDDFNFSFGDIKKRCIFTVASVIEPHTGGGNIFVNYPISKVNGSRKIVVKVIGHCQINLSISLIDF
jgi:hypothetical protein